MNNLYYEYNGEMDRLVLGKRIAVARERLKPKMSQEELARQLGIEQSAVGHYENGRRSVPFDKLIKIKEILGVSGSYLLDDDPVDDECIIKSPKEHTEDLKKTLKVLSSNTGDALSLHMNINSFHEAVTAKERFHPNFPPMPIYQPHLNRPYALLLASLSLVPDK